MNKPYPNGDTEQLMELNGIVIYRLAPFLFSNINGTTRDIHKFFKEDVQMKNGIITRAENKLVMCCAKANHLMIQSQEQTAATINQLMSTKWGKYAVAIPAALSGMTITAFASGGDATNTANEIFDKIMGALGPGVVALGTLVAVVGGIQVGKGFTREDADAKASGVMTMVGGIIIGAVGGIVTAIKINIGG